MTFLHALVPCAVLLLLACADDPAPTVDTAFVSTAAPWAWSDCELAIDVGVIGGIDTKLAFAPSVHRDGDAWRMWYSVKAQEGETAIAHAVSTDGVTWTDPAVVLPPTSDDSWAADSATPNVLQTDDGWQMYLDAKLGSDLTIARCVSEDGFDWHGCATVVEGDLLAGIDDDVLSGHVVRTGETYRMYYTGASADVWRILVAESVDGETWTDHRVLLDLGSQGEHDSSSLYNPFVMQVGEEWRLLYSGRAPMEVEGTTRLVKRLVGARSDDGLAWEDFHLALDLGCAGEADAWRLDEPWVAPDGDGWRLWYDGFDQLEYEPGVRRILTATSP